MSDPRVYATFSLVGRAADGGAFGVAVATARPFVGALVPFVGPGGAVATQARVNTELGRAGLARLAAGEPVAAALAAVLATDGDRELRQLHGIDGGGSWAHTGAACVPWAGHRAGRDCSAAGNMLVGPEVLDAMTAAFEAAAADDLARPLLAALAAGQAAGGDRRGKRSAALLVWSERPRLGHNLRVDDHPEPVAELGRLHEVAREQAEEIRRQYGLEGLRLFGRVKT